MDTSTKKRQYPHCKIIPVFLWMVFLLVSCNQIDTRLSSNRDLTENGERISINKSANLKIISKGTVLKKKKKSRLLIKYIQYSIDGHLIEAHEVKNPYEKTIALSSGKHFLHIERAQRGILSARALILNDGDCYAFSILEGQTGIFQIRAFPDETWDAIGFTGVQSWEKVDSRSDCFHD